MQRTEFSKRTKAAAFLRSGGRCEKCTRKLTGYGKDTECHHRLECTYGGSNGLDNAMVLCVECHGKITGRRARDIAKSDRVRARHAGIRKTIRRSFATNRDGPYKRKMSGEVVKR